MIRHVVVLLGLGLGLGPFATSGCTPSIATTRRAPPPAANTASPPADDQAKKSPATIGFAECPGLADDPPELTAKALNEGPPPQDVALASCQRGSAFGCFVAGMTAMENKDQGSAAALLENACNLGCPVACGLRGSLAGPSWCDMSPWFERGCKAGDKRSCRLIEEHGPAQCDKP